MGQRELLQRPVRKNLSHLRRKVRKLAQSPEIIHVQEAAAKKMLAETRRLAVRQEHASDRHRIEVRVSEEIFVHDGGGIWIWMHADIAESRDAAHEFAVSARVVDRPSIALTGKEIAAAKLRTDPFGP